MVFFITDFMAIIYFDIHNPLGFSQVLNELEKYAPNKEAYSQLCLYLTLPRLHEHSDFRDWNPSAARVQCWTQVSKTLGI